MGRLSCRSRRATEAGTDACRRRRAVRVAKRRRRFVRLVVDVWIPRRARTRKTGRAGGQGGSGGRKARAGRPFWRRQSTRVPPLANEAVVALDRLAAVLVAPVGASLGPSERGRVRRNARCRRLDQVSVRAARCREAARVISRYMPREVSPAQASRYARTMRSVREAILAMIVSSSALACGGTGSAPMDATADAFEGSSEGSVEPLTDAGTEPDDGAGRRGRRAASLRVAPLARHRPRRPARRAAASAWTNSTASTATIRVSSTCSSSVSAGQWFYSAPVSPPVDAGLPIGDAGCPTTYAAAQSATFCDTPSCVYPEGTCTCEVAMGNDSGTLWACTVPALPTGCPGTIAEAQSSVTCPSYALRCFYPGGTCTCFTVDAGAPWRCTVPEAGCPATRPRLGTTCDAALAQHCTYIPVGCSSPTGDLFCSAVLLRQRVGERPERRALPQVDIGVADRIGLGSAAALPERGRRRCRVESAFADAAHGAGEYDRSANRLRPRLVSVRRSGGARSSSAP